jgi:hypothetical protein
MPNKIYESATISLIDGTELFITPLKIKYLRDFMERFEDLDSATGEDETLNVLLDCTRLAMKQYYPSIKTVEDVEDSIDIKSMYKILEICAGIKLNSDSDDEKEKPEEKSKEKAPKWSEMDIVALESELFLLGIWKDYDELESSLSMQELTTTLNAKRDSEYKEKRFLAAMQGVDLDSQTGKNEPNAWEKMKAKVFSGGKTSNPDDITSLQGVNAQKAGFGIGMGLGYEDLTKKSAPSVI